MPGPLEVGTPVVGTPVVGVGAGVAVGPVIGAGEVPVVWSSDIGSFSHEARAFSTGARGSASSGSSRAPTRSIH